MECQTEILMSRERESLCGANEGQRATSVPDLGQVIDDSEVERILALAKLEGMLAPVRREILVVAAAVQALDEDAAFLARSRLRWALAYVELLASCRAAELAGLHERIRNVVAVAERWLVTEDESPPGATKVQRLLKATLEPAFRLRHIDASNALLVGLDLEDLPLDRLALRGATVVEVRARGARLEGVDAAAAMILRCSFNRASLRLGCFEHAVLADSDLSHSNLERTRWCNARVSRCRFGRAVMAEARLDDATFIDCDFRDADLERTTGSARFVRCDLRGTSWRGRSVSPDSFEDCELEGAKFDARLVLIGARPGELAHRAP
jgi:uncharacterized protein YjbI with pentapeptide repeats